MTGKIIKRITEWSHHIQQSPEKTDGIFSFFTDQCSSYPFHVFSSTYFQLETSYLRKSFNEQELCLRRLFHVKNVTEIVSDSEAIENGCSSGGKVWLKEVPMQNRQILLTSAPYYSTRYSFFKISAYRTAKMISIARYDRFCYQVISIFQLYLFCFYLTQKPATICI